MESEERDASPPAGPSPRRAKSIPVDEWFSGHRYAERRHVHFPVEIHGAALTLHGIALDVSASGILVGVPIAALQGLTGRADLLGVYVTLHHTWEDGVTVSIPGHGAIGRAHVARIVAAPQKEHEVYLGLQFLNPLPTDFVNRWAQGQRAP